MSPENSAISDVESLSTKEALNKLKTAIRDELEREQVNLYILLNLIFCFSYIESLFPKHKML